jgi:hypothetical protein
MHSLPVECRKRADSHHARRRRVDSRRVSFAILDSAGFEITTSAFGDPLLVIDIDSANPTIQAFAGSGSYSAMGAPGIGATVSPVPEPEVGMLFVAGLAIMGWRQRRTRAGLRVAGNRWHYFPAGADAASLVAPLRPAGLVFAASCRPIALFDQVLDPIGDRRLPFGARLPVGRHGRDEVGLAFETRSTPPG